MKIERLCETNIDEYIEYLKKSLADEPDMMTVGSVNEEELKSRLKSGQNSVSLVAVDNGKVLGRLEYHTYSCIQDGYKMAYVNWVYVAREERKKGIAKALFKAFEDECRKNGVDEYFLIQAKNQSAARFYASFEGALSSDERILRKTIALD